MDVVRSYVVPSLHFAEVVHLREEEDTDEEPPLSSSPSMTSSPSSLSVQDVRHKGSVNGNGILSSVESSSTSAESPSLSGPQFKVLDGLRQVPSEEEEEQSNYEEPRPEPLTQDTTQEIDIDAILGYPIEDINEEESGDDVITVIEEEEIIMTPRDPHDYFKKSPALLKPRMDPKSSLLDKIRATLSRSSNGHNVPNNKSPPVETKESLEVPRDNGDKSFEKSPTNSLNRSQTKRKSIFKKLVVVPSERKTPNRRRRRHSNGHIERRSRSESFSRTPEPRKKPPTEEEEDAKPFTKSSSFGGRLTRKKPGAPPTDEEQDAKPFTKSLSFGGLLSRKKPVATPTEEEEDARPFTKSTEEEEDAKPFAKSSSFGGLLSQSMFPLGKYSDRSLPRRNRGRSSPETEGRETARRRPRSLSRSKFGLPSRRSSLVRSPSPVLQDARSEEKIQVEEQLRPVDKISPQMSRSEPRLSESPGANPQRQYGRRSGRFRRAPPSQEVITIHSRPQSSERPPSGPIEGQRQLRDASARSRQRAASLPRLNGNSSRQQRRSQARNSTHGNDICSLQ